MLHAVLMLVTVGLVAKLSKRIVYQCLCPLHEQKSNLEDGSELDFDKKFIDIDLVDLVVCRHRNLV